MSCIHNVFYIALLKLYHRQGALEAVPEIELESERSDVYEVQEIVSH